MDHTAASIWRTRVLQYLQQHGPVADPSGFAATRVARSLGWPGTSSQFSAQLATLERQGKLRRQVRGKRTLRLELTQTTPGLYRGSPTSPARLTPPAEIPQAGPAQVGPDSTQPPAPAPAPAWYQRRLDRTLLQLEQARQELAQTRASHQQLLERNRLLQQRLARAERNLEILSARRRPTRTPEPTWAQRLGSGDRERLGRWLAGAAR